MTDEQKLSDEFLNALVDDELTPEEKAEAYVLINRDKALSMRLCELRKIRDLVKLAYENPPAAALDPSAPNARGQSHHGMAAGIASAATLILGIVLGWQLDSSVSTPTQEAYDNARAGANERSGDSAGSAAGHPDTANGTLAADDAMKILFHLNTGDAAHINDALNEVEGLLKFYQDNDQRARIELIVNGDGIDLLRVDASPYPERVRRLQKQYSNLRFVACQNSIDRLAEERGLAARLIPGTVVIDSGVAQIMRRQQEGWAYIQV